MPTLTIGYVPKTRKPPMGGFRLPVLLRSTFRVLLAPPRLVQSHFLSLDFSRIARHQTRGAERRFQCCIILDQRASDAVAHRAGLPAFAAAVDVHQDVESAEAFRQLERLAHDHA